jgi:hypothetical protein
LKNDSISELKYCQELYPAENIMMEKEGKEKDSGDKRSRKISRKEAIRKAGYAAFSATTMMLLLNDPARALSVSDSPGGPADPPTEPFGGGFDGF